MSGWKLVCAAVAGYALATVAAIALTRRNEGGGLNVTRRGRRVYVTVIPCGTPGEKPEAFDWRKPGNEPEGKEGAAES